MSESIESTGRTVEEAISEALLQLGARRDEVEVEIIDEGKSGFLGVFGGKPARVLVRRKPRGRGRQRSGQGRGIERTPRSAGKTATNRGRDRKATGTTREPGAQVANQREDKTPRAEAQPRSKSTARNGTGRTGPTTARQKSRGFGRRGPGRPEQGSQQRRAPEGEVSRGIINEGSVRERDTPPDSSRRQEVPAVPVGEAVQAVSMAEALRGVSAHEAPAHLEKITSRLMTLSGFPCRCEVQEGEYHLVKIITDDSSAGMLIGRHGSTVDALEHIVERMASQAVGDRVNMNLDVNNYRRRREENLIQRVQEIAQRVASTGREMHLEPLCARERRIVHLQVVNIPGIRTYTVANSNGKHVVVAMAEGEESAGEKSDTFEGDATAEAHTALSDSAENGAAGRAIDISYDDDLGKNFADAYDSDIYDPLGDSGDDHDDGGQQVEESTDESWLDDRHSPGEPTRRE